MPRARIETPSLMITTALLLLGCASSPGPVPAAANGDASAGGECESNSRLVGARGTGALAQHVDVGGRALFIACQGVGRPTVVMESGLGDPGIIWGSALLRRVAEISRVCAYDRAGLGYSDLRPDPTDSGKISSDLHALLRGASIAPPYVLVGHSIGGMHIRVYDDDHPGEVSGMVLVDAAHPDQFLRAREKLSAADWAAMDASTQQAWHNPDLEPLDWLRSSELARRAGSLGDRPLHVLTHDPESTPGCMGDACLSAAGQASWEALWQEMQEEFAALSTRSAQRVAKGSGHYIQAVRPELVIDAIAEVVDQTR